MTLSHPHGPAMRGHLERLVAADSQNPPRALSPDHPLFGALTAPLPDDMDVMVEDLGDGCINVLAVRGTPELLVNVHVDTVPVAPGWTKTPHVLTEADGKLFGLGACDIKGAAACLLALLPHTTGDVAVLFSSDEEFGKSRCVRHFIAHTWPNKLASVKRVVVCEPTEAQAVLAHRGIATATGAFTGVPGHASAARALDDSALHDAATWTTAAIAHARAAEGDTMAGLSGLRFNLGRLEGGVKPNMIAGEATLRFGVRPGPAMAPTDALDALFALAPTPARTTWTPGFVAPSLPAVPAGLGPDAARSHVNAALEAGEALAAQYALPVGPSVDFWTEASLFSEAGLPVVVFGPGNIAQAHAADEWVSLASLDAAMHAFERMLNAG